MFIRLAARMEQDASAGDASGTQPGGEQTSAGSRGKGQQQPPPPNPQAGPDDEVADGDRFDISSLDPKAQKYIKQLRQEAAQRRTESNQLKTQYEDLAGRIKQAFGAPEEQVDPAEHIGYLQEQTQTLAFQNAVLSMAVANGIPQDGIPYMQFLIEQASNNLEEGEELDDEAMESIIEEVRMKSGAARPGMAATSVQSPRGAGGTQSEVTAEQFASMGLAEKTDLFRKNPQLYERLHQASKNIARKKR